MIPSDVTISGTVVVVTGAVVLAVVGLLLRELMLARRLRELANAGPVSAKPAMALKDEPDDLEITKMAARPRRAELPRMPHDVPATATAGDDDSPSNNSVALTVFAGDPDLPVDEPTGKQDAILLWAAGQTDVGKRRRRNEDHYVVVASHDLYVVADGMGGYAGGDVASKLAVDTIAKIYESGTFVGEVNPDRPPLGNQLVWAIEAANQEIWQAAEKDPNHAGMGTTVVAARFARKKQRAYICHVGDSRCYRLRSGALKLLTVDHTLAATGVSGPLGGNLRRALGVAPKVKVDLIIDVPSPNDIYLICSDGLSKLVSDDDIAHILCQDAPLDGRIERLIAAANAAGGRDNVTVILVAVQPQATTLPAVGLRQSGAYH